MGARGRRVSAAEFRRVHDGALLHSISRLLQAIYRESAVGRLWEAGARADWQLPYRPASCSACPRERTPPISQARDHRPVPVVVLTRAAPPASWHGGGIRCGAAALPLALCRYHAVFAALRSDFQNSVANVILNRLLGSASGEKTQALEPAYQGHQSISFSRVADRSQLCGRFSSARISAGNPSICRCSSSTGAASSPPCTAAIRRASAHGRG